MKKVFRKYLAKEELARKTRFLGFVGDGTDNPDFDEEDVIKAKANPRKYLQVPYLFEIQSVFKIYKDGKYVGFAFDCVDHVDAAMIQDGSWAMVYVDDKMNVVAEKEGQS